jgi:cephalosporin hydroxylase
MRYMKKKVTYNLVQAQIDEWSQHREYGSKAWSALSEYPIMFSFIHIYQIDNVIECGTCGGGSALAYSFGLDQREAGVVHTWDVRNKTKAYDKLACGQRVVFHNESFCENAGPVIEKVEGKRLFFIDGDHLYEGALKDFLLALEHIRPGDVLVAHDATKMPEVLEALNDALSVTNVSVKKRYTIYSTCGIAVLEF